MATTSSLPIPVGSPNQNNNNNNNNNSTPNFGSYNSHYIGSFNNSHHVGSFSNSHGIIGPNINPNNVGSLNSNSYLASSSASPFKKSPNLSSIPPPPPSSSSKYPLELTDKNQVCNLKINLDKSYFINGETVSGKVNILLTDRQFIKRIKLQLCGYEKIYHHQSSSNIYQTNKFYSININVPPSNVNIETTSLNSLTPTFSDLSSPQQIQQIQQLQQQQSSSSPPPIILNQPSSSSPPIIQPQQPQLYQIYQQQFNNNNKNNNEILSTSPNNINNKMSIPIINQHSLPQQQQQQLDYQEFEIGNYEYPFTFYLPKYLAPSLNYIGYLSIFYLVHCKIEYSKGREWKEQKIVKSSELWITGINKVYQDYLLSKTSFQTFRLSEYLWQDKSRPIEMALCLLENNCYIGDTSTFFIKIKNPLMIKFSSIRVELFQQISFFKPVNNQVVSNMGGNFKKTNKLINGNNYYNYKDYDSDNYKKNRNLQHNTQGYDQKKKNGSKYQVSQTQIVSNNYDCKHLLRPKNEVDADTLISTHIQIQIPHKIEDDQVFPTTHGFLSIIKHFFIVSVPSISSDFKLKVPIHLWQRFDDINFRATPSYNNSPSYNYSASSSSSSSSSSNNSSNISSPQYYNQPSSSLTHSISSPSLIRNNNSFNNLNSLNNNNNNNNNNNYNNNNSSSNNSSNNNSNNNSQHGSFDNFNIIQDLDINNNNNKPQFYIDEDGNNTNIIEEPKGWIIYWLPKWKDESLEPNCNLCDSAFSIIKRTHHCRYCGGVFCEACSNQKLALYNFGVTKKVRICLMCNDKLKDSSTSTSVIIKRKYNYPFLVDL